MPSEGLRLAFFGTPEFSVPTLQALCEAGREPLLVVSQPDRRAGRGRSLRRPPVVEYAVTRNLPVEQPDRVGSSGFLQLIAELKLDVAVVVAFGQIFPQPLLDLPTHGCVNVHASLLPRHRGAAPIQAAIRALDRVAGVCSMQMEAGLDSGPVLGRAETTLTGRETAGQLSARLAHIGAALLLETVDRLVAKGELVGEAQEDYRASYAPRLTKADGVIDWSPPVEWVDAQFRAMTPWPGAQTSLGGQPLKILEARPASGAREEAGAPGSLLPVEDGRLRVACGSGVLEILRVQRPGRRTVSALDLVNAEQLVGGELFGTLSGP